MMTLHELSPDSSLDNQTENTTKPFIPYGMPEEIWSDVSRGSSFRRGQWFFFRYPHESLYIIKTTFGLDDEEIARLKE